MTILKYANCKSVVLCLMPCTLQAMSLDEFYVFSDIHNHLYLHLSTVLAQRGFLKEQSFVNYLKYLLYWKKPEYAKFLKWVKVVGTMQNK